MKRTYSSPLSSPTEVAFEQALLVATATLLLDVNPLENENAVEDADAPGSDMYFEI